MKVDEDDKQTKSTTSDPEKEKLKEEAKEFYFLAKNYRSERYMKDEKSVTNNLTKIGTYFRQTIFNKMERIRELPRR